MMLFTAVKHGQFLKFCNFEARYLKNGRSHKKIYFYSKSSKSGQKCIGSKKITIFFFTTRHKILPFGKKVHTISAEQPGRIYFRGSKLTFRTQITCQPWKVHSFLGEGPGLIIEQCWRRKSNPQWMLQRSSDATFEWVAC